MAEYTEVPVDDIEVIFDTLPSKSSRRSKLKLFLCCMCTVMLCVSLIALIVTVSVVTPMMIHKYYWVFGDDAILFSTEYQIDIEFSDDWLDRDAEIVKIIDTFASKCKYMNVDEATETSGLRVQYYKHISGKKACNSDDEIRVREYISGDYSGITVDIKGNDKEEINAFYLPYSPAKQYLPDSSQKCERDRHQEVSKDKYSRETRIFLPSGTTFDTCKDIADLFPESGIKEKYYDTEIQDGSKSPWYLREYSGTMDGDTQYKMAFTLDYHHTDDAEHSTAVPRSGEWSIRLYTKDGGHSHDYNEQVQKAVEKAWLEMS